MAKRRVKSCFFQSAVSAPGLFGGDSSLSEEKKSGIEMYTGVEPGFLSIFWKGEEVGVPMMNVKSLVWWPDAK